MNLQKQKEKVQDILTNSIGFYNEQIVNEILSVFDHKLSDNLYDSGGYKIYTPIDDESAVVIEGCLGEKKTIDVDDFDHLMRVMANVQDY